jgi:hypothetical protein
MQLFLFRYMLWNLQWLSAAAGCSAELAVISPRIFAIFDSPSTRDYVALATVFC